MSGNQSNESEKSFSRDIELSEEMNEFFEKKIKSDMKKVPNGDYFSCYVRFLIDIDMIEASDPLYCFYESTENLFKILQLIPQIKEIKNKIITENYIEPTEQIILTKRKINELCDSIFLESKRSEYYKKYELDGRHLSNEVKIFIFLRIITNIEVYLEDRLRNTLEHNKILLDSFIKNLGDDMPKKWRTGKNICPYDYYNRMNEIIFENVLLFPYHEISGRTNHIYRKAFNLDLMMYPKKENLIKIIKIRHKIIHRGSENIFLEHHGFSFDNIEDYIKLSYDFVCWVEDNLAEYDLRKAFNRTYNLTSKNTLNGDNLG